MQYKVLHDRLIQSYSQIRTWWCFLFLQAKYYKAQYFVWQLLLLNTAWIRQFNPVATLFKRDLYSFALTSFLDFLAASLLKGYFSLNLFMKHFHNFSITFILGCFQQIQCCHFDRIQSSQQYSFGGMEHPHATMVYTDKCNYLVLIYHNYYHLYLHH